MKKTAEEILSKHNIKTGIYFTKGVVRSIDSLEAMHEFAKQQAVEFDIWKIEEGWELSNMITDSYYRFDKVFEDMHKKREELYELFLKSK